MSRRVLFVLVGASAALAGCGDPKPEATPAPKRAPKRVAEPEPTRAPSIEVQSAVRPQAPPAQPDSTEATGGGGGGGGGDGDPRASEEECLAFMAKLTALAAPPPGSAKGVEPGVLKPGAMERLCSKRPISAVVARCAKDAKTLREALACDPLVAAVMGQIKAPGLDRKPGAPMPAGKGN